MQTKQIAASLEKIEECYENIRAVRWQIAFKRIPIQGEPQYYREDSFLSLTQIATRRKEIEEKMQETIRGTIQREIQREIQKYSGNKEYALAVVKKFPELFISLDKKFYDDEDVVSALLEEISRHGNKLSTEQEDEIKRNISARLRGDYSLIYPLVEKNRLMLRYADEYLREVILGILYMARQSQPF